MSNRAVQHSVIAAVRAAAGEGAALLREAAFELQHAGLLVEAAAVVASGAAVGRQLPAPWTMRFLVTPCWIEK